jgi:hypothetical protein
MIFWREKEKNCASRFEAKKAAMGDEGLSVASQSKLAGILNSDVFTFFKVTLLNDSKNGCLGAI